MQPALTPLGLIHRESSPCLSMRNLQSAHADRDVRAAEAERRGGTRADPIRDSSERRTSASRCARIELHVVAESHEKVMMCVGRELKEPMSCSGREEARGEFSGTGGQSSQRGDRHNQCCTFFILFYFFTSLWIIIWLGPFS